MKNKIRHSKVLKSSFLVMAFFVSVLSYNNCSGQFSSVANGTFQANSADVPNPPQYPPAPPVGGTITTLKMGFTLAQTSDQYVTFGQIFVPGHVPKGNSVTAAYDDGALIPIQIDAKATHADGSLRHAIITLKLKGTAAGVQTNVHLLRTLTLQNYEPIPVINLINAGFDSVITTNIGGTIYTASAKNLLQKPNVKYWVYGNMATEWITSGPLTTADGVAHPHLTARFLVRAYAGLQSARVSVSLENDYTYVPSPSDQTYDLKVTVGANTVLTATGLTQFNQSRWRRVFYWGQNPNENIQHETSYLIASRAVSNYDTSVIPSPTSIANYSSQLSTMRDLMDIGILMSSMPGTGGRPELGLLPAWTVQYLVGQDPVSKDTVLTMGELAGTWQTHYRDENTDYPVTIDSYPYMTISGNPSDAFNPVTNKSEFFPTCVLCTSPNGPDNSHQPDLAYVPYLVTGDYFYLEEMQFWAGWNLLILTPQYRQEALGIVSNDQVRGQAWSLRSIARAAYITPDDHPLKSYFTSKLENNIAFYNQTFLKPNYNVLGVNLEGEALGYSDNGEAPYRGFAPWMDNFFTSTLGMINELGFTDVAPALNFKTKFPVSLMLDPSFCWILSTSYNLYIVGPSGGPPYYTSLDQVWANGNHTRDSYGMACNSAQMQAEYSLPNLNYLVEGTTDPEGYTAVMQMGLAYALTSGAPNSQAAWEKFMTRVNIADYTSQPQFAIIPRR